GSLRPTFGPVRIGFALATASLASLTTSLARDSPAPVEAVVVLPPPKGLVEGCSARCGMLWRNLLKAITLEALRKMLWQTSLLMLTINSSNSLKASALYSIRGSRWPYWRKPILWRKLSIE